jgi:hypothetical protein
MAMLRIVPLLPVVEVLDEELEVLDEELELDEEVVVVEEDELLDEELDESKCVQKPPLQV